MKVKEGASCVTCRSCFSWALTHDFFLGSCIYLSIIPFHLYMACNKESRYRTSGSQDCVLSCSCWGSGQLGRRVRKGYKPSWMREAFPTSTMPALSAAPDSCGVEVQGFQMHPLWGSAVIPVWLMVNRGSSFMVRQVMWIRHPLAKQGTDRFLSGSSETCPNSLTRKGWGWRRPSVPRESLSDVANAPSCFPSRNGHCCQLKQSQGLPPRINIKPY